MGEKLSLRRRVYNGTMTVLVRLGAVLTCGLLLFLIGYIFYRGIPGLSWEILTTQTSYIKNTVGILPNILNTLYIILVAMALVLPIGVGAAIYLTEYARSARLVRVIEFATETLTGIPSIIFGLVGMLFFVQKMGLPGGGHGPGRRQMAHDTHCGAAQRRGRYRDRVHFGGGAHCQ